MSIERTGSCLCGKITLKLTGEPVFKSVCYCDHCSKVSGSICPGNLFFQTAAVEITDPEAVLKTFSDDKSDSGGVLLRSFCGSCGSRVKIQPAARLEFTTVPIGIVDGDKKGLEPNYEFFAKRRPAWFVGYGAESFPEVPPWLGSQ